MPSSLVDNILFSRPSAAVAARLSASLRALFFRSVCGPFGAALCAFFFRRVLSLPGPAGPSLPSRRLVAPRAPRLSLRTCRLTPARCSALPRSARGCSRVPLFAVLRVSRAAQRRGVPCLPAFVFLLPAAEGGVALLPFVPVPLLPFRQPGPCLRLCLSSRLWRLFFLAFVFPAFAFVLPVAFGDPYSCLCFCLAFFRWAILMVVFWISFSFFCFWCVYRTVVEKGRVSNREKAKGKGMVRGGGQVW